MPKRRICNLFWKVVRSCKELARKNESAMEQELRESNAALMGARLSAIAQIEAAWERQHRSPTAQEVDDWITTGRA